MISRQLQANILIFKLLDSISPFLLSSAPSQVKKSLQMYISKNFINGTPSLKLVMDEDSKLVEYPVEDEECRNQWNEDRYTWT